MATEIVMKKTVQNEGRDVATAFLKRAVGNDFKNLSKK